ncbi:MAG: arsenate-mycothiol transferase ArsC [Promethearchaeota archaeon]
MLILIRKVVIFACVGNSCRSQMAEGFARNFFPNNIMIISTGTRPSSKVNPIAIQVMKEISIDISDQKPKTVTSSMIKEASHFISTGCDILDSCLVPLVQEEIKIEDWEIEDPIDKDIGFFRQIRDEIERKVLKLREKLK